MLIIPAIDLKEGKCVRLKQGKMDQARVYYEDPLECAEHWRSLGATRLHLVDLDGAMTGETINLAIISKLRKHYPELELQVGGGIRSLKSAHYYLDEIGIDFIILGTYAINHPSAASEIIEKYPNTVFLGLDIAADKIHTSGWIESSPLSCQEVIARFADSPLAGIILTDISKDGMLSGIDSATIADFSQLTSFPLIVAGGVRDTADIHQLKKLGLVTGVICGKSLYEKSLDFTAALAIAHAR